MKTHAEMLTILIFSPAIILGIHICLSRTLRSYPRQAVACYAAVSGYAPVAALLWAFVFPGGNPDENVVAAAYAFIVYSGFAYFYFHLFNTSETARRIRLIHYIYMAGPLTEEEVSRLYDVKDVVYLRLKRLTETGQLVLKDGHYFINNRLLYAAAVAVAVWQKVLGMPSSLRLEGDTLRKDREFR